MPLETDSEHLIHGSNSATCSVCICAHYCYSEISVHLQVMMLFPLGGTNTPRGGNTNAPTQYSSQVTLSWSQAALWFSTR